VARTRDLLTDGNRAAGNRIKDGDRCGTSGTQSVVSLAMSVHRDDACRLASPGVVMRPRVEIPGALY
jgi:hypothetical protein